MLQNVYLDAKIGVDPAENEPPKECCVVGRAARNRIGRVIAVELHFYLIVFYLKRTTELAEWRSSTYLHQYV